MSSPRPDAPPPQFGRSAASYALPSTRDTASGHTSSSQFGRSGASYASASASDTAGNDTRTQAIHAHESFLASVPPIAVFKSTRVALYEGFFLLLLAAPFIRASLLNPNGVVITVAIFIIVIAVGQIATNLAAGKHALMTLTHTHLHHPQLPQPLPLVSIDNVRSELAPFRIWRNAFHTVQFEIAPFLSVPPIKRSGLRLLFGASVTRLFNWPGRPPMLEIAAPRFTVNGEKLGIDALEDTVVMYVQAAHAHQALTALRASH